MPSQSQMYNEDDFVYPDTLRKVNCMHCGKVIWSEEWSPPWWFTGSKDKVKYFHVPCDMKAMESNA